MARPANNGLDYFPLDVDYFDSIELMKVSEVHGLAGEMVAVKLTAWIYKNGYAVEWDEMTAKIFARRVMFDPSIPVGEIVETLFDVGYLDRDTFTRTGKLTSRGIQKRWAAIQKQAHRPAEIDPELNLLEKPEDPVKKDFAKTSEDFAKTSGNFANTSEAFAKTSENFALNKIKEKEIKAITPPPNPPLPREVGDGEGAFDECSSREEMLALSESVIASWNETFAGTDRTVNPVNQNLKPFYRENLIAAQADGITLDQFRRAFAVLKRTPRFEWQLHSAVKPDNVRLLLTEGENARKRKRAGPVLQVYRDDVYSKTAEDFYKR